MHISTMSICNNYPRYGSTSNVISIHNTYNICITLTIQSSTLTTMTSVHPVNYSFISHKHTKVTHNISID